MKIQILSDLHLEFFWEQHKKINKLLDSLVSDADTILLAGDTFGIECLEIQMKCIATVFHDKQVIFIPGNHEYYRSSKHGMDRLLMEESDKYDNLIFLENAFELINDNTIVIGGCGWNDEFNQIGANMMNDCRLIKDLEKDNHLSMLWNRITKEFFRETLGMVNGNKKIICMTHNSPLLDFIPEKYAGTPMNPFFANDWSDLVQEFEPDIWVSGHFHQMKKFKKYNTLFIENGYGYFNHAPVKEFVKKMIINI